MRDYFLDPALCTVSINPKQPVNISHIDLLVITSPETPKDFRLIIDSMADGIPVVLPRTFYTTKIIANGVTGILYGSNDELYSLISYLVSDPMLREEIGTASRNSIPNDTDIESLVSLILDPETVDADS